MQIIPINIASYLQLHLHISSHLENHVSVFPESLKGL